MYSSYITLKAFLLLLLLLLFSVIVVAVRLLLLQILFAAVDINFASSTRQLPFSGLQQRRDLLGQGLSTSGAAAAAAAVAVAVAVAAAIAAASQGGRRFLFQAGGLFDNAARIQRQ